MEVVYLFILLQASSSSETPGEAHHSKYDLIDSASTRVPVLISTRRASTAPLIDGNGERSSNTYG